MSVDNSELLMLLGGKKSKSTIGKAGQQGFGVGVYGGDPADLTAMGLAPMEGCKNPNSENYGNYIHTNGSVMAFIPAFAIRIGNTSAPLYSKYGENTIEIGDVELNGKDGWAILRGFYDGGRLHQGFFIDKYLCSKDPTGKLAVSVMLGDPISLYSAYEPSVTMPDCDGKLYDAITLGRARGEHYALVSCYQWAIISLISLAHAQAATSADACAWYDAAGLTNYPKGNNANATSLYKDVDDKSLLFNTTNYSTYISKTGAGVPLAKTTHNGQKSGITDVNGNKWQPVLGWNNPLTASSTFGTAKLSVKMHDFTKGNCNDNSLFDEYAITGLVGKRQYYWGSSALYPPNDSMFDLCGVIPRNFHTSANTKHFGEDGLSISAGREYALLVAGSYRDGYTAGVWDRSAPYKWSSYGDVYGFRAAAYPP